MRLFLIFGCAFIGVSSALAAPAWQEGLSPVQPGSFPPLRPLRAQYRFGWTAFTAAEAKFELSRAKGGLLRMEATAGSTGFPRTLWRMDARHVGLIRERTFRPVSVLQTETYKDESRKTAIEYSATGVVCTMGTKGSDDPGTKVKRWEFPDIMDLHGTLHWVCSQRLQTGDKLRIVAYPSGAPYLAEVEVLPRTTVNAMGKRRAAILLDLKLSKIDDDDLKLKPYTKFKRASLWVGDDADRMLLRVEAEIFVGSVWAGLTKVEFTGK